MKFLFCGPDKQKWQRQEELLLNALEFGTGTNVVVYKGRQTSTYDARKGLWIYCNHLWMDLSKRHLGPVDPVLLRGTYKLFDVHNTLHTLDTAVKISVRHRTIVGLLGESEIACRNWQNATLTAIFNHNVWRKHI